MFSAYPALASGVSTYYGCIILRQQLMGNIIDGNSQNMIQGFGKQYIGQCSYCKTVLRLDRKDNCINCGAPKNAV